eukprot:CAMPEP_0196804814 /NCGR_PEP_ID=MMETSP1362-20130617/4482_1 /TAXON_ID=163516 /ORGANISM="Leptocylindrus danicus, Strain CCMP1856" /LENGTH=627 /DNA_ID=CAMNT_0042177331 /DNA_START=231 /DNA_END=2115 /DNA_ORIENTATION=-
MIFNSTSEGFHGITADEQHVEPHITGHHLGLRLLSTIPKRHEEPVQLHRPMLDHDSNVDPDPRGAEATAARHEHHQSPAGHGELKNHLDETRAGTIEMKKQERRKALKKQKNEYAGNNANPPQNQHEKHDADINSNEVQNFALRKQELIEPRKPQKRLNRLPDYKGPDYKGRKHRPRRPKVGEKNHIHYDVDNEMRPKRTRRGNFMKRVRKPGEKPRLFLHLGVQKTGTTTIQASLRFNSVKLFSDGYQYICHAVYPVHLDGPNNCLGNRDNNCTETGIAQDPSLLRFRTCLQRAAGLDMDAIYSGETFISDIVGTENNWKLIQNELKDFNVTVVLTYRRFFEWLPSYYSQMHTAPELHGEWDIVEEELPTFSHWLRLNEEDADPVRVSLTRRWGLDVSQGKLHPIESEISRIRPYFPNIVIHNMHDGDFVKSFYCDILNATKTCDDYWGGTIKRNPTKNHDYAILALAAHHRGMLKLQSVNVSRTDVASSLEEHHNKIDANAKFPVTCLSPSQEKELLDRSILFEKRILGNSAWYQSEHGETEHRAKFLSYVKDSRFCNIDVERVLSDSSWRQYFNTTVFSPLRENVRMRYGEHMVFDGADVLHRRERYRNLKNKLKPDGKHGTDA